MILILYSVTDMASYHTANIAHKFITSRHQYRKVRRQYEKLPCISPFRTVTQILA